MAQQFGAGTGGGLGIHAAAFGAIGAGEAIVPTDGSDKAALGGGGRLCFDSPPSQSNPLAAGESASGNGAGAHEYVNERF